MITFVSNQIIHDKRFECTTDITVVLDYLFNLKEKLFTYDTESPSLDPYDGTLLHQVGDLKHQFVIDQRHPEVKKLNPFLEDYKYLKLFANAKHDIKQAWHSLECRIDGVYDLILAERCILNGLTDVKSDAIFKAENGYGRFSLEGLTNKYLGRGMDKSTRASFIGHSGDFFGNQVVYAAGDIDIPYEIYGFQKEEVKKYNLEEVVKLENDCTSAFAEMEFNGIGTNLNLLAELSEKDKLKQKEIEVQLDELVLADSKVSYKYQIGQQLDAFGAPGRKCSIKWTSPKQKVELLNLLGFDTLIKDDKTGEFKDSCDIKVLKKYKNDHPLIPTLIEYNEVTKLISTYGAKFAKHIHGKTGRMHTSYFQIKNTGRVSSRNPNVQNIPPEKRIIYDPLPGNEFITADYSNMELRLIGEKSKEEVLIDAFNNEEDAHSKMAMMIQKIGFGRDVVVSKTENTQYRTESKSITFCLAFGGSEFKVAEQLGIDIDSAKELLQAYFAGMPKLKPFFTQLKQFGLRNGYIRTFKPYNRIRWFPQHAKYKELAQKADKTRAEWSKMMKLKGSIERESSNTPIQGSAADIVKKALILIFNRVKNYNRKHGLDSPFNSRRVQLLLQVHDEIVLECPKEISAKIAEDVKFLMEMAGVDLVSELLMKCDPHIGIKWDH